MKNFNVYFCIEFLKNKNLLLILKMNKRCSFLNSKVFYMKIGESIDPSKTLNLLLPGRKIVLNFFIFVNV